MTADTSPDRALAARAAAEAPRMALDPDLVLAAAHRHVRRRTALHVSGAVAAAVAIAVALAGVHGVTRPQPADRHGSVQHAHPIGDGALATLVPGVVAVNRPPAATRATAAIAYESADGDRVALPVGAAQVDLGLTSGADPLVLASAPARDTDGTYSVVAFVHRATGGTDVSTHDGVGWLLPGDRHDDIDPGFSGAQDAGSWYTPQSDAGSRLDVLVLPSDLPDPRVLLGTTTGLRRADGSTTHVLELPTFASPGGQLLSVVQSTDPAAVKALLGETTAVVLVGSDGTVRTPCSVTAVGPCPDPAAVPGLVDEVRALGGRIVAPAPTPGAASALPATSDARQLALADGVVATTTAVATGTASLDLGIYRDRHAVLVADGPSATTARIDLASGSGPVVAGRSGPLSLVPVGDAGDPSHQQVYAGALPANLASARVFLVSTTGFRRSDGTVDHALEVPVFATKQQPFAGVGSGRWYAVELLDDAAARVLDGETWLVFGRPDGTVVDPTCGAACDANDPETAAVRALLAAPAPWDSESPGTAPAPVTLAHGVVAARGPFIERSVSDDGGTASTELGTFADGSAAVSRSGVDNGSEFSLASAEGETVDVQGFHGALSGKDAASSDWALDHGGVLRFGMTPNGATRAFYWSTATLTLPDGRHSHVVELPTFTLPDFPGNPVGADRRWYLVDDSGAVAGGGRPQTGGVVFGTADGTVVDPACGDGACQASAARPYHAAVQQLLAHAHRPGS